MVQIAAKHSPALAAERECFRVHTNRDDGP
jgi:hypothetical protein